MAAEIVMILIYTLVLSLIVAMLYKLLTNQDEMKKIKEEMNYFKERSDQARKDGDMAKMNQYTSDMLKMSSKQFKQTMKPMFASMFIFIIVLGWLGATFGEVLITTPFAGFQLSWFLWYIVIAIPATMVFRKLMGVM